MTHTRSLGTLGCAVLLCLVACGEGGAGDESPAAARVPEPVAAAAPPEASAPAPLASERGVRVWLEGDGLVRAVANDASRRDVLNALTDAAGFTLSVGPEVELDRPLTLRVEREPLEVALARMLVGVPHALFYEADPASAAPRLARVTVGIEWTRLAESTARQPRQGERGGERGAAAPAPEERKEERSRRLRAESLENVWSEDEELRSERVSALDVTSREGFAAATDRLANDESPLVRAAAAEALIASDASAVPPLLEALADRDPRVVLAALDSLEFVADAGVIPALSPLLEHRDAEVRERAELAIEMLQ